MTMRKHANVNRTARHWTCNYSGILFNTKTVTDTKVEKNHTNMCPETE